MNLISNENSISNETGDPCGRWANSQLEGKLGPAILCLGQLLRRRLEAALARAGLGLTPSQAKSIVMLHLHGPLTQQGLASHTDVEPSTLVSTLDVMEREDLAHREPSPSDRRAHLVRLTPKGEELVPRLFALWETVEGDLVEGLTKAERAELQERLGRLIGRLSSDAGSC
ncbi:MAG TPA: MarR family transcriptional regulator [Gemmatimonadota bacterium]|nr:MarR family transcriptional regulator [Gemmatimonadota bacterium]